MSSLGTDEHRPDRSDGARRILLCYDGSVEARKGLDRVAELAAAVPSRVTVLSVAEPLYHERPFTGYADPREEQEHRRLLDDALEELRRRGVHAESAEASGDTADSIVEAARERGADLVVVGSRHRKLVERLLFGSVSAEVVVDAPCDVLVVR
jgi:nucleotide-binding universal stress UspA family protein